MNPFIYTHTCEVCGEPGVATPSTNDAAWRGGRIMHSNPAVCADVLDRRRRDLEKREAAVAAREGS